MRDQQHIPLSFVLEHKAALKGLARVALRTFKFAAANNAYTDWQDIPEMTRIIQAPPAKLVDHYIDWSHARAERYTDTLPPHMVSQWGLASATELLLLTHYDLAKVINQGVTLNIYGDLPRQQDLIIHSKIQSVHEIEGVARVCVQIITGTRQQPRLVETLLHVAFLLESFRKSGRKKERHKQDWQGAGTWQASAHDGFKFALLTGDFNPIHWIGVVGKLSPFKHKVLHGFGMLVRTYECLPASINHLDVRFLSPVVLPSPMLEVQILTQAEHKSTRFRLISGKDRIHLLGSYTQNDETSTADFL